MSKRRICARINLGAFEQNIKTLHARLPKETGMLAVIKADGYGHGAVPLANVLEGIPYVKGYCTATFEEAKALRDAGMRKDILLLSGCFPEDMEAAIRHNLTLAIYSLEAAKELSDAAQSLFRREPALRRPVRIHIKLDTGMHRIGFLPSESAYRTIEAISRLPELSLEGIFTHFARADEEEKAAADEQMRIFSDAVDALRERGLTFSRIHCANSAAAMEYPPSYLSLVRTGIAMYGLPPSDEIEMTGLLPVLSLHSHVMHVKTLPKGAPVGYGGTFVTPRETRIATIPVGYGDGYPRSLSNRGYVLIRGRRAPIVGRICMDQLMADVTEIPETAVYDPVTLIGTDGKEAITVDALSELCGRFPYEFVCDIGKRVPREYIPDEMTSASK